jgi:tripartite-type tricarboxylate transporter receptor subunit TctC
MADPGTSLAQVRAGNVKAFAVTAAARLSSAPDIPTLDEAGLPGFDISQWHGLWLPKGAPRNIIAESSEISERMASPGSHKGR